MRVMIFSILNRLKLYMDDSRADHQHWRYDLGCGTYDIHEIRTDKLRVEVYISPTGRSQQVYVNGIKVYPFKETE